MKVQIGEIFMHKIKKQKHIYTNKTQRYLLPCLKEYGEEFTRKIESVYKVAVGIGDIIVNNRGIKHEKHIFILITNQIAPNFFLEFLNWIKWQPMYEDDYVFDNIQKSTHHMVVLKIPEKFYPSFESFKEGKFSAMYTEEELKFLFKENTYTFKVLIKSHEYKMMFMDKLNLIYGTRIKPEDYEGELALPPNEISEFFNHHLKK